MCYGSPHAQDSEEIQIMFLAIREMLTSNEINFPGTNWKLTQHDVTNNLVLTVEPDMFEN